MLAVRGFRALALVLAFVLALGAMVVLSVERAAAATGDIVGTVTSSDGTPLDNVDIYLSTEVLNGGAGPTGPAFPSGPAATTGPTGGYTISGVPDGIYTVLADAGGSWVQSSYFIAVDNGFDPSASADFELEKGVLIAGTVRPESNPAATIGGIGVGAIMTDSDPLCGCYAGGFLHDDVYFDQRTFDWDAGKPLTPLSGTYTFAVPLGHTYEINAQDPSFAPLYEEQSWDHLPGSGGGCGCGGSGDYTPVTTPDDSGWPYGTYAPTSAIDFDLRAFSDYLWFQVKTVRNPGPADYAGAHVFLQ